MRRDFPSCFSESGVQVADSSTPSSSSKSPQNLVSCVYQCRLRGGSCFITVTWSKNLMGQGVSIGIQSSSYELLCKVDIKPWLFTRRKGFRSSEVDSSVIDIYWDFSSAKFGSGPEPLEGYCVAVAFNKELVLILGDSQKEVSKKIDPNRVASNAVFVAKREHIFGKKLYGAKAQFCGNGQIHDIAIECDTERTNDPSLVISIDRKAVMQVKRLRWKFRGNQTIMVDGVAVEVYWDVHSWVFGNATGNAVFLFQTGFPASMATSTSHEQPSAFSSQGPEGFSLTLYAWKND